MKKTLKWILKAGFTIGLFVLIFYPPVLKFIGHLIGRDLSVVEVSFPRLLDEIQAIELSHFLPWILFAFAVKAFGMASSMIRWNLLLKGQGIHLPWRHLIGTFLTGRFFGMFLPSTIGLDGYRLFDVARHTGKIVESTTVIAIEKLIGFIALTFLVFLTLPLGAQILDFKPVVLAMILVVLAAFVVASFVMLFNPRLIRFAIGLAPIPFRSKIESKLHKISLAVTAYSGQKALLLKAVFWGICVHAGTSLMYFGTAMAVRAENIHIFDILFAAPLMIYGTVLGPSIGGEGIRELVFIALLGAKTTSEVALLFSHMGFWVGEILSLAGGVVYLIRPPEYKPKMVLEEMNEIRAKGREMQEVEAEEDAFQADLASARKNARIHVQAMVAAGLWAGALIGLAEGITVLRNMPNSAELQVLWYGMAVYGLIGLCVAAGIAAAGVLIAAILRKGITLARAFGVYFGSTLFVLGLPIARFLIRRDVLDEQALSTVQNLELVGAGLGVLIVCVVLVAPLFKIGFLNRLLHPLRGFAVFAAMVGVVAVVASILAPPAKADDPVAGDPREPGREPQRGPGDRRHPARRPPALQRLPEADHPEPGRAGRRRDALFAHHHPGELDQAVDRVDPLGALPQQPPRRGQGRHAARGGHDRRRADAGGRLPDGRLRDQHQPLAAVPVRPGLRGLRVPGARALLRRGRVVQPPARLQRAAARARAVPVQDQALLPLLPGRPGRKRERDAVDQRARGRSVLPPASLHGAPRPVLRAPAGRLVHGIRDRTRSYAQPARRDGDHHAGALRGRGRVLRPPVRRRPRAPQDRRGSTTTR